ncbi:hypothetical protein FW320_31575 [Azospirillum sp. Vi22]|nr:hypothetical protein [Azospirillum baldaniorum]NUB10675.1 hypothetical protein [Azospirillum baldaniorum]
MVRWGLLRGVTMSGLMTLAASCQTTGYNSGERVEIDCERSPIQSGWGDVFTPPWGKCHRTTASKVELMITSHSRYFEIPGGYGYAAYQSADKNTYIFQQSVRDIARLYKNRTRGSLGWEEPRMESFAGQDYQVQRFTLRRQSCAVYLLNGAPMPMYPGYRDRVFGYVCANRLEREVLERLLTSFSYDISRAESAPVILLPVKKAG